jgi:hypothetical protein
MDKRNKHISKIQTTQTQFLRNAKECTKLRKHKNDGKQNGVNITHYMEGQISTE